jgi:hypothetical protein
VVIQLLPGDVAAIKRTTGLARAKKSTYLLVSEDVTTDLAGK